MQTLYHNDNERSTEKSSDFSSEIGQAIGPIFEKWFKKGFKIRELSHAAIHEILFEESLRIIKKF